MLRALLERDIVPDVIVGCSAGAFNGCDHHRARPTLGWRFERLEATWESLRGEEVSPAAVCRVGVEPPHPGSPIFLQPGPCATSSSGVTPPPPSISFAIPLRVVAADLDTGDEVVFAHGPRCWPAPRCRGSTHPHPPRRR